MLGFDRTRLFVALALVSAGACGGVEEPAPLDTDPGLDPVVTAPDAGSTPAASDAAAPAAPPSSVPPASLPAPGTRDAAVSQGSDGGVPSKPTSDGGTSGCVSFGSSFEAIQKIIFEKRGCTADACHGSAKVGGLDLRADVAWENLVDAKSANSKYARVQPGTAVESFL